MADEKNILVTQLEALDLDLDVVAQHLEIIDRKIDTLEARFARIEHKLDALIVPAGTWIADRRTS